MKSALSITLDMHNSSFLDSLAQEKALPRSVVINRLVDAYRKQVLKKRIVEGFSAQTADDVADAMSDFGDFLSITDAAI